MAKKYEFNSAVGDFLSEPEKKSDQFNAERQAVANVREVMRHMPGGAFSGDAAEMR